MLIAALTGRGLPRTPRRARRAEHAPQPFQPFPCRHCKHDHGSHGITRGLCFVHGCTCPGFNTHGDKEEARC